MAKKPTAGRTKTRLCPPLLPEQAARLYEAMLGDTLTSLQSRNDCELLVAIDEPDSSGWFAEFTSASQVVQCGESLGERLDAVLTGALDLGFTQAFAIGSDSPDLPSEHLDSAFVALDQPDIDVVLGPASDGGYYLIGVTQAPGPLVTEVTMSTQTVLQDTLAVASKHSIRVHCAPTWHDVDTPADLDRLVAAASPGLVQTTVALQQLGLSAPKTCR